MGWLHGLPLHIIIWKPLPPNLVFSFRFRCPKLFSWSKFISFTAIITSLYSTVTMLVTFVRTSLQSSSLHMLGRMQHRFVCCIILCSLQHVSYLSISLHMRDTLGVLIFTIPFTKNEWGGGCTYTCGSILLYTAHNPCTSLTASVLNAATCDDYIHPYILQTLGPPWL